MQLKTLFLASLAVFAAASPTRDQPEESSPTKDHLEESSPTKGHPEESSPTKDQPEESPATADKCTPATYECTLQSGKPGWNVCNTSGDWVVRSCYLPHSLPLSPRPVPLRFSTSGEKGFGGGARGLGLGRGGFMV